MSQIVAFTLDPQTMYPNGTVGALSYGGGTVQLLEPNASLAGLSGSHHVLEGEVYVNPANHKYPHDPVRYCCNSQACTDCTATPKCSGGPPPLSASPAPIAILGSAKIGAQPLLAGGQRSHLVVEGTSQGPIPIFDAAEPDLPGALTAYWQALGSVEDLVFHIYKIADAPSALSELKGKLIGVPVLASAPPPSGTQYRFTRHD